MSRRALIICLAVLAVMILGIGVAVSLLYSGTEDGLFRRSKVVPDESRFMLLPAVPADAVFVACFSDSEAAAHAIPDDLPSVPSKITVSLHYNGDLQTLYVFDAGRASSQPSELAVTLLDYAESKGMYNDYVDCSEITDGSRDISRRSLVLMSGSDNLVKSSKRHLEQSISIMDAAGFYEASALVPGQNLMFFANSHARPLMAGMFSKKLSSHHPFVASLSQWTVAEVISADESGLHMNVSPVLKDDPSEFMNVLAVSDAGTSEISRILPSYTVSALTLPMDDIEPYIAEYQKYMDSKQSLQSFRKNQRRLENRMKVNPNDFFRRLDVREVAKASFVTGGRMEEVNLMRIGREDTLIFIGTDVKSFKDYRPDINSWPYDSFIPAVFGKYFELDLKGEKPCFTYIDGWIVSGSLNAVRDYVEGRALSYTLAEYMADAGQKDLLASESALTAYYSFTECPEGNGEILSSDFADMLRPFCSDCDYSPAVLKTTRGRSGVRTNVRILRLDMQRTKAPEFVRDTTVAVPEGPFRVMNSGTGKMNLFYQNTHGSLCLQDENGKNLWGASFNGKIAGTAYNVDYYANGKLQIIFGSGTKIYLIDRLGRFVNGFPVDLSKEILLGPDVYDFNDSRAYNIMVLHKDNTIEMYNLKGNRPSTWKTIAATETIKALPERIKVGGNSFWVVRTAIQTLIYPFMGGTPLTSFEGDAMILPDSKIEVADGTSVKAECYDGRTRTVKLK